MSYIVGDDAFPLNTRLMKPYPYRNLEKEKRIFNYRLSRARRVVENAFGILSHRWRVFLTTIKLSPDKVTDIIFAACCLHNLMVEKNKASYTSAADLENTDHTLVRGTRRNDQVLTNKQRMPVWLLSHIAYTNMYILSVTITLLLTTLWISYSLTLYIYIYIYVNCKCLYFFNVFTYKINIWNWSPSCHMRR